MSLFVILIRANRTAHQTLTISGPYYSDCVTDLLVATLVFSRSSWSEIKFQQAFCLAQANCVTQQRCPSQKGPDDQDLPESEPFPPHFMCIPNGWLPCSAAKLNFFFYLDLCQSEVDIKGICGL